MRALAPLLAILALSFLAAPAQALGIHQASFCTTEIVEILGPSACAGWSIPGDGASGRVWVSVSGLPPQEQCWIME